MNTIPSPEKMVLTAKLMALSGHHSACKSALDWLSDQPDTITLAEMVEKQPEWAVWLATRPGVMTDRELRLFAVFCARSALALIPSPDPRSVAACDVAERFAEGAASQKELADAYDAAYSAATAYSAAPAAYSAASSAAYSASSGSLSDAYAAASSDASSAASSGARSAAYADTRADARAAARAARSSQVRWILSRTIPNLSIQ